MKKPVVPWSKPHALYRFNNYTGNISFINSASTKSFLVQWQERNYLLRINRRYNLLLSVVATAAKYDHEKHYE
jgi:hypothetical protein